MSALPVLERRLAHGELALRGALSELRTATVELDSAVLANANTVAELARMGGERPETSLPFV